MSKYPDDFFVIINISNIHLVWIIDSGRLLDSPVVLIILIIPGSSVHLNWLKSTRTNKFLCQKSIWDNLWPDCQGQKQFDSCSIRYSLRIRSVSHTNPKRSYYHICLFSISSWCVDPERITQEEEKEKKKRKRYKYYT